MVPKRLIMAGLGLLVVMMLCGGWSSAIRRDAWMEGYMMGRLSVQDEGAASPAPYGFRGGMHGRFGPHHHGGGFGLIFPLLGLLFIFFGARRIFRGRGWGGHRGHWGGGPPWARQWHGGPPWGRHWHGEERPRGEPERPRRPEPPRDPGPDEGVYL